MKWISPDVCPEKTKLFESELGVKDYLAALLVRLGFEKPKDAKMFLDPRLAQLEDPFEISFLKEGAKRLVDAISRNQSICIMGDYDVDGVTGTTLLVSFLKEFGLNPRYFIPRRMEEGYGLNLVALKRLIDEGPIDLLVVVDSGTNAVEPVAELRRNGIDVMILDHHRSKEGLPEDCILINPHVHDTEDKPWKHLCSVGLVFKLVHGTLKLLRDNDDTRAQNINPKDYLDLVAMGTIADLMPLMHENRIFAKHGLKQLEETGLPGIHALFDVSGISRDQILQPEDVSFRMGPRINASGRLADAALSVDMLLNHNFSKCLKDAQVLDKMNRERQDIEQRITEEARSMILESNVESKGLVVYSAEWHTGVVGIVSGKLSREFHKPCIVLGQEGDLVKGSGRSLKGVSLVEVLGLCTEYLEGWGGHPLAVGVSLKPNNLDVFKDAFDKALNKTVPEGLPEKTLEITHWVSPSMIDEVFMGSLECMRPFGEGNPEPIWGISKAQLVSPAEVFSNKHYRFAIDSGKSWPLKGIAWNKANRVPPSTQLVDLAVKIQWNYWNGRRYLQLLLVDWRLSEGE